MGQITLVYDLDDLRIVFAGPDGPVVDAVDFHIGRLLQATLIQENSFRSGYGSE